MLTVLIGYLGIYYSFFEVNYSRLDGGYLLDDSDAVMRGSLFYLAQPDNSADDTIEEVSVV